MARHKNFIRRHSIFIYFAHNLYLFNTCLAIYRTNNLYCAAFRLA